MLMDQLLRSVRGTIVVTLAPVNRPIWTLLSPHFFGTGPCSIEGYGMKWKIAFSILALSLATQASADDHRGGDAALGALSGAVVLGPIGAVAGAVVGYTAGPSIAHAWGFRRSSTARQRTQSTRAERQETQSAQAQVTPATATVPATPQPRPAVAAKSSSKPPPVQTLE
jgi:hypothetical protein